MSALYYSTSDAQTRKLWAKRLLVESLRGSAWGYFLGEMSEDPDSIICLKQESSSEAGDTVTCSLQRQLQGDGVQGTSVLEGNEEAMVEFTMSVVLDELRHADKMEIKGMTSQRVKYDKTPQNRLKNSLADWWKERLTTCLINQAVGNTSTDIVGTKYTGNNATVAADANHKFWSGAATADEGCSSSTEAFTLNDIDRMVAKATSYTLRDGTGVPLKKAKIMGDKAFALIAHPFAIYDLRTASGSKWVDITKAMYQGKGDKNPFTDIYSKSEEFQCVGKYGDVWIFSDPRMPKGQNSSTAAPVNNTRRAVLLGAGALSAAFGMGYGEGQMKWTEKTYDYDKWLGVASGLIFGIKKTRYNSLDYGVVTLTSYTSLG